jgi:hypothetical protein
MRKGYLGSRIETGEHPTSPRPRLYFDYRYSYEQKIHERQLLVRNGSVAYHPYDEL